MNFDVEEPDYNFDCDWSTSPIRYAPTNTLRKHRGQYLVAVELDVASRLQHNRLISYPSSLFPHSPEQGGFSGMIKPSF